MKRMIFLLTIMLILLYSFCLGKILIVDYYQYIKEFSKISNTISFPTYSGYLRLAALPLPTKFDNLIRQPAITYPGDYFYPPDMYIDSQYVNKGLYSALAQSEKKVIKLFINENIKIPFSDSLINTALMGYAIHYPNGDHREAYAMFYEGDTVYVVSGWLGKFLSFYRVVPADFRLNVSEFIRQLDKITPLSTGLKGKEAAFMQKSDPQNYLLEYIDRGAMIRFRNYLLSEVLPPGPSTGPKKLYNLIEVTKFYDKEAIP
jgi:hypothetical protein